MRHFTLDLGPRPARLVEALVPDGEERRCAFQPHGLSIVRVGATGTVAIHTWPEHGVATLDCYGSASERAPLVLAQHGWTRRTDSHFLETP